MHIVIVHQYHHNPDCPASCRHYDFAERWSRKHEVTIISSTAWEEKRITEKYPWVPGDARLIRLPVPYRNEMGFAARTNAFVSFAASAIGAGRKLPAPDVVIGSSTPLTAAWAARRLARRWGVPFVFEVRDLWPDFPIDMGAVPSPLQKPLRSLESNLYRAADHVVALSPDIAAHIQNSGVARDQITTLVHGTDVGAAAVARSTRTSHDRTTGGRRPHTILYAGAFGRANDIPTILAAAEKLAPDSRIRFLFAGHGFYSSAIQNAAERLPNIQLAGPIPRHEIFDAFASAFLSLVTFANVPSVSAGSPSKLFDSLASGCPVLLNTDGWMRRLVQDNACGWHVEPEEPNRLAERIVALIESPAETLAARYNAVQLAASGFDRTRLADEFERLLDSVVARQARRTKHDEPTRKAA